MNFTNIAKNIFLCAALVASAAVAIAAQDFSGRWEGSRASNGNQPAPDGWTYDWDFGKWSVKNYSYVMALELDEIAPGKYRGKLLLGKNGQDLTQAVEMVASGDELTGETVGRDYRGNWKLGGGMKLTLREEGGWRYLEGKASSIDFKFPNMIVALRQQGGGGAKPNEPAGDFAAVETDARYFLKFGDRFLTLTDDESGVVSKSDGDEASRKWKFEAAPDGYGKAFRIVPEKKDEFCLEPAADDSGKLHVVAKKDKPEGDQYWRFEKTADGGVQIVNVKFGGRGLFIEDEDAGTTIIRSRNDTKGGSWKLEKK